MHYVHNPQQPQSQQAAPLPGDPSFDVLGVPLATVHEGAEGKKVRAASTGTGSDSVGVPPPNPFVCSSRQRGRLGVPAPTRCMDVCVPCRMPTECRAFN